ncbi:MAG: S-layer homology domain-containing protein, partial [Clostridia bacterium]|nr:S-layer homology domain-containing protein [Clostridia bacterium]
MRKCISMILCLMLLVIPCNFMQGFAEEETVNENVEFMQALGILKEYEGVDKTAAVSRGLFVDMLITALQLEDEASLSKHDFTDVTPEHPYNNAIAVAYSRGYVNGNDAHIFSPNDSITLQQSIKIVLSAMGYDIIAQQKGGFAGGYMIVAGEIGIFNDVSLKGNESLSFYDAVDLLAAALDTEVVLQESVGGDKGDKYVKSPKTLMNELLNIYEGKGIVEATEFSDINRSKGLGNKKINISGELYENEFYDAGHLLGMSVTFYYRPDSASGEKVLLHMEIDKYANDIYNVAAKDILPETTLSTFAFYDEDGDKEELDIRANAAFVYNGNGFSPTKADLIPENGNVSLIDNDNDGRIDVVIICDYISYVVDSASADFEKIYTKFDAGTVQLADSSIDYGIYLDNAEIGFADLKEWDVISVQKSKDEEFITIKVCRSPVSGTVTEISEDDGKTYVNLDGDWYTIVKPYPSSAPEIKIGSKGIFMRNIDGEIVAADFTDSLKDNYAYLTGIEMVGGLHKVARVQFMDMLGEFHSVECADKVRLNGDTVKADKLVSDVAPDQMIIFDVNSENQLNELQTAVDITPGGGVKYDLDNFSYDAYFEKASFYKWWGGGINVAADTVIVYVPTDRSDKEAYKIEDRKGFGSGNVSAKKFKVFDLNQFNAPKIILFENFDADGSAGKPHVKVSGDYAWLAVSDVCTAIDPYGETKIRITGYDKKGQEQKYFVKDSNVTNVTKPIAPDGGSLMNTVPFQLTKWGFANLPADQIKVGDVIQLGLDAKNQITGFRMIFSAQRQGVSVDDWVRFGEYFEIGDSVPKVDNQNLYGTIYSTYGEVVARSTESIRYKTMCPSAGYSGVEVERVVPITTGKAT